MDRAEVELTPGQKRVLEWITDFWLENEMAPSVREARDGLGFKSNNALTSHVQALLTKGYLKRMGTGRQQARNLVPAGWHRSLDETALVRARTLLDECLDELERCNGSKKLMHRVERELLRTWPRRECG